MNNDMQESRSKPLTIEMRSHSRLGFSLSEYKRRYDLILGGMKDRKLDALLVRSPENITYVSGYETPGYYRYHCLIMAPDIEPVLVLRRFEELNVPEYSWLSRHVSIDDWENPPKVTADVLQKLKLDRGTIGVEKQGWFYTVDEHETLTSILSNAKLTDAIDIL